MRQVFVLLSVVLTLCTSAAFGQGAPVLGTASVRITFNGSPEVDEDTIGTLSVDLSGVVGQGASGTTPIVLAGFQISVMFDQTRLNVADVSGGTSSGFTSTPTFTTLNAANSAGLITLSASHTNPTSPTGNVIVAKLRFRAISTGTAAVSVDPTSLSSAFQAPSHGPTSIPATGSSTSVVIQPPASPPGAFVYGSPANGSDGVGLPVTLTWAPSSGAAGYRVYFGESSNPPEVTSTSSTSFEPRATTGTAYFWRIESYNAGGTVVGPTWSFTTDGPPCPFPKVPDLSVPATAASGAMYQVNWSAAADADEYVLSESTSAQFTGAEQFTLPASSTSRTFKHEVTSKTRYYYRIVGRKTTGGCNVASDQSIVAMVLIDPGLVPPPQPEPDSATNIVPVVGSLPGGFDSYFRTTVQLHNPTNTEQSGALIYRPREGGEASIVYVLSPRQTLRFQDVVESMGLTGIGSLDVRPDAGGFPIVVSRIFNDAGEAGTSGMTIEQIDPKNALEASETGVIVGPGDLSRARLNIGVRTLNEPATISFVVRSSDGVPVASGSKALGANVFVQQSSSEFLGAEIGPDAVVEFTVSTAAIIYGTITDTTTNDPSYQVARKTR